jgi:hypothetical protein
MGLLRQLDISPRRLRREHFVLFPGITPQGVAMPHDAGAPPT